MNFTTALKAHEVIEKIELNNSDLEMFNRAIENGISGVQLVIRSENGTYHSTIYKKDRINLLSKVLREENDKLMTKLREL